MTIEQHFEDFAKTLVFKPGKRETFLNDLKKSLQQVPGGGYRTKSGAKVDLETYMRAMAEQTNLYVQFKPSLKEKYQPVFPVRSEGIKSAHKKLTETILQKAFAVEGYVFQEGATEQIIEHIANNFLPSDSDQGLIFRKVNDTPIGSVFGKESYSLDALLNNVGASRFLDDQATRISRLSHKGSLRQKALSMAEPGAKNSTIEKLVEELEAFEKRSLRVGKRAPALNVPQVEEEFRKMMTLNGNDHSSATSSARLSVSRLDDIQTIKGEISKIQPTNTTSNYDFNE